jgi:hypothetical protein
LQEKQGITAAPRLTGHFKPASGGHFKTGQRRVARIKVFYSTPPVVASRTPNFVKPAACMAMIVGLSASALASRCDTLSAIAAGAAGIVSNPAPCNRSHCPPEGKARNPSYSWSLARPVHCRRQPHPGRLPTLGGGGTEVLDPRAGDVCLGVWKRGCARDLQTRLPHLELRHEWKLHENYQSQRETCSRSQRQ